MKDYYERYIEKKIKNTLDTSVPKVSKGQSDDQNDTFATFGTEHIGVNTENFSLETFLSVNPELSEQFEFEVSERTAIMTICGNIEESEAERLARTATTHYWIELWH